MKRNYKFHNSEATYFVCFAVKESLIFRAEDKRHSSAVDYSG